MPITIHPAHRQLATITWMNVNEDGDLVMGMSELRLIMPLLRDNLLLVMEIDGLKEAGYAAQLSGNMDLLQYFVEKLDEMEAQLT
ncbi:hypothetical protein MKY14_16180 [Paenibacillus sp. FSL R5-0887]|uniref:DUF7667 family protein n=1 Tax=Paenibacillus TaxID=44249 RepID=UPI00096ED879|nr:hypothetical protein [Paenibacillus odorifer]OMD85650.1 hypothetical protein BSK49_19230 [Paenibacillus odorifer]